MNPTTANTNSSQYFQNIIADIAEKNRVPPYEKGLMSYYKLERRAVVEFYRLKHQEGLTHSQAKVALKEMARMRSMAAAAERLPASSTAHHQSSLAPRLTPHNTNTASTSIQHSVKPEQQREPAARSVIGHRRAAPSSANTVNIGDHAVQHVAQNTASSERGDTSRTQHMRTEATVTRDSSVVPAEPHRIQAAKKQVQFQQQIHLTQAESRLDQVTTQQPWQKKEGISRNPLLRVFQNAFSDSAATSKTTQPCITERIVDYREESLTLNERKVLLDQCLEVPPSTQAFMPTPADPGTHTVSDLKIMAAWLQSALEKRLLLTGRCLSHSGFTAAEKGHVLRGLYEQALSAGYIFPDNTLQLMLWGQQYSFRVTQIPALVTLFERSRINKNNAAPLLDSLSDTKLKPSALSDAYMRDHVRPGYKVMSSEKDFGNNAFVVRLHGIPDLIGYFGFHVLKALDCENVVLMTMQKTLFLEAPMDVKTYFALVQDLLADQIPMAPDNMQSLKDEGIKQAVTWLNYLHDRFGAEFVSTVCRVPSMLYTFMHMGDTSSSAKALYPTQSVYQRLCSIVPTVSDTQYQLERRGRDSHVLEGNLPRYARKFMKDAIIAYLKHVVGVFNNERIQHSFDDPIADTQNMVLATHGWRNILTTDLFDLINKETFWIGLNQSRLWPNGDPNVHDMHVREHEKCFSMFSEVNPPVHSHLKGGLRSQPTQWCDRGLIRLNANWVKHDRPFIASSQPRSPNYYQWWSMVAEQRVGLIVDLTSSTDNQTINQPYTQPKEEGPRRFNNVNEAMRHPDQHWFEMAQQSPSSAALDMRLNLSALFSSEELAQTAHTISFSDNDERLVEGHTVERLHIQAWPDHDVMHPCKLLRLAKTLVDYQSQHLDDNSPILIHCRAGVGRTGTLACCMQLIGVIDRLSIAELTPQRLVSELKSAVLQGRYDRGPLFVQTKEQLDVALFVAFRYALDKIKPSPSGFKSGKWIGTPHFEN